jgi:hypothetical protein
MSTNLSTQKFLGASVIGYNSSVGWNGTVSTVTISLVEDTLGGDAFQVPLTGSPQYFNFYGFKFGGIVQNVTKTGSSGGSPLYEVILNDPRQLLNGVHVILGSYYQSVLGIPNIVNVFGYYEGSIFGSSQSNGSGMPWNLIVAALNATVGSGTSSNYGGPIQWNSYVFTVDLSNIPTPPQWFRIGGNMSLMQLIQEVCDAVGCDFFVELVGTTITFYTINRINVPNTGIISKYVSQTPGAVSKQIGEDMVNEVNGKFLVGGKKRDMYFQPYNAGQDFDETTGTDNPVWWFWGYDNFDNPIVSNGLTNYLQDCHVFTLDARKALISGVGSTYPSSMGEMQAALIGIAEWKQFLTTMNNLQYIPVFGGKSVAKPVPLTNADKKQFNKLDALGQVPTYTHNGQNNPHFGKALSLGLIQNNNAAAIFFLQTNWISGSGNIDWGRLRQTWPGKIEDETSRLYEMIKGIASENYGKKIMVALPQLNAAFDTESNRPIFSVIPINGAYIDESQLVNAAQNGLIPLDLNGITDENNLFKPYVRFDNIRVLDFSEIPDEAMYWSADGQSIFVECSIGNDVIFLNPQTLSQPRVVLTLPGRVKFRNNAYFASTAPAMVLQNMNQRTNPTPKQQAAFAIALASKIPFDPRKQFAALPALAAVPLESQIDRYGPWYAQGTIGAIEYEEDEALTPWNYGTYINLDAAGNAKVSQNIANLQRIESGTIEFPGVPDHQLGTQLLQAGPYISSIRVTVGAGGITTEYRMEMWKPKPFGLNRSWVDTLQKMGKLYNQYRRNYLETMKINRKASYGQY